ncbi:PASTA domain-containing protein [Pseudoflavitalea sp. X16]|uniref:PASTA domain-containing protein n=1 Tax=Paraflavitalea devenefica TaxID=2716334 RepID=UPI00142488D7|nr:PASTA domain-containing protein [Paraflavitalea devenefica]NII29829.1 PASTA domain-containing protein [Paraflavitalea devenefica]
MFKFITKRPLWQNILFAIILVIILIFLFLQSLNLITKHGDTLVIPSVTGRSFDDAKKLLEEEGFEVKIQDSIYNDTAKALAVLRQFPEGEAIVKANRIVYLTINRAVPPEIEMPNLERLTFRSAELAIKQYGLKLEDTVYEPNFARNAVLEQHYKGQRIKPGTRLPMGSGITLVLGNGLGQEQIPVPDLFGKTFTEAKVLLESYGFGVGATVFESGDSANAYIFKQQPAPVQPDGRLNMIRQGQSIDIWLQATMPVRATAPDSTTQQPQ